MRPHRGSRAMSTMGANVQFTPAAAASRAAARAVLSAAAGSHVAASESTARSEEHTSELQSRFDLVCRLLLEKKKKRSRGSRTHVCDDPRRRVTGTHLR